MPFGTTRKTPQGRHSQSFNSPSSQVRKPSERVQSVHNQPPTTHRGGNYPQSRPRTVLSEYSRSAYGTGQEKSARRQIAGKGSHFSNASNVRRRTPRKILVGVCCVLLGLILAGGAFAYWYFDHLNNTLNNKSDAEKRVLASVTEKRRNLTDPFYVMIIGSDSRLGTGGPDIGARSDTNILARIDPKNATVTLISIPRDTMIDIDGHGVEKFNAAYAFGGISSTIREASQLTGIKINNYAEIDFNNLVKLVDAVGGVDVDVPEVINDPDAGNITIPAGMQHLNGEAALVFARSRAYADGDFTRTSNQRLLIEALIKKVLQSPIPALPGIIENAAQCVSTDLTLQDILSLATQFKEAKSMHIYSAMLPSKPQMVDGISYVVVNKPLMKQMIELLKEGEDPSQLDVSGEGVQIGSALEQKENKNSSAAQEPPRGSFAKERG